MSAGPDPATDTAPDLAAAKTIARRYVAALDAATPATLGIVQDTWWTDGAAFRCVHPFDAAPDARTAAGLVWGGLKRAMTGLRRRMDIFFAGPNGIATVGGTWVVHAGHLVGLHDRAWLGIPPTGRMAFVRYAEFLRIEDGRIAETALFVDVPAVMLQAGLQPFAAQTGAHVVQPGPETHDGLLFDAQPPEAGRTTLALIEAMIADLGSWTSGLPLDEELRRTWAEDMIWWGPAGIGATYTIPRYMRQHAAPFRTGFSGRARTGHLARLAEGQYGGFFGWPNFTATPTGGFMGMPATAQPSEFRVVDLYRRAGDKLAENWVHIDLLHAWRCQGLDILARTTGLTATDLMEPS